MTRAMRRAVWGLPVAGLAAMIVATTLGSGGSVDAQTPPPAVEINRTQSASHNPTQSKDGPIHILLLGSDARPGEALDGVRSDGIQLVSLNPQKGGGSILGFPRDSYVAIPGGRGTRRINEGLFYGGADLMVETVESVTGIKIDYYALTGFKGLESMVRGVGNIPIEIKYPMKDSASGTNFTPGKRQLGPARALAFTRDRKSAPGGDFGRSENQGRLILAALKKFRSDVEQDPATLFTWIRSGLAHMQTDLSFGEVFELAVAATQVDPKKVKTTVAPGTTGDAGGASVVFLSDSARRIYDDIRDDGMLSG